MSQTPETIDLTHFDVRVIPNGLDFERYRPVDRLEARRQLGLPESARIVLFVADLIEDERKGLRALLAAAEAIRDVPRLLLVTLGRGGAAVNLARLLVHWSPNLLWRAYQIRRRRHTAAREA